MLQKVDNTEILLCAIMYKGSDKDLLRTVFKIGAMKLACSVVEGRHTMKISCAQCCKRWIHDEIFCPQCYKRKIHDQIC